MSVVDFWHAWWSGNATNDMEILGLEVLWWVRIGKLAQFAAGLTVVLDLVGPARLRAMSRRAEARFARGVDRLKASRKRGAELQDYERTMSNMDAPPRGWGDKMGRMATWPDVFITFALLAAPFAAAMFMPRFWSIPDITYTTGGGRHVTEDPVRLMFGVVAFWLFLVGILFLGRIFAVVGVTRAALLLLPSVLFTRPLAWALEGAAPGHSVRWAALAIFTAGFTLELAGT